MFSIPLVFFVFSTILGVICGFVTFFLFGMLGRKIEEEPYSLAVMIWKKRRKVESMFVGFVMFTVIMMVGILEIGRVISIFPMEECKITGDATKEPPVEFLTSFSMGEMIDVYSFGKSSMTQMETEKVNLFKEKDRRTAAWKAFGQKVREGWWNILIDTKTCMAKQGGKFVIKFPE